MKLLTRIKQLEVRHSSTDYSLLEWLHRGKSVDDLNILGLSGRAYPLRDEYTPSLNEIAARLNSFRERFIEEGKRKEEQPKNEKNRVTLVWIDENETPEEKEYTEMEALADEFRREVKRILGNRKLREIDVSKPLYLVFKWVDIESEDGIEASDEQTTN